MTPFNNLASFTDKSVFVGAVGSGTTHQGVQEESHPPMNRVIGTETSVPALDFAVIC